MLIYKDKERLFMSEGDSTMVAETGQLEGGEHITAYLERNPEAAATIPLCLERNSARIITSD